MNKSRYPLRQNAGSSLQAASGKTFNEINLESLLSGRLDPEDLRIHSSTLIEQARFAKDEGFHHLAQNLVRAAELTRVPNDTLLSMYEALRPGRSTISDLHQIAEQLENEYDAPNCAEFIRQAAAVYLQRKLTKE